MLHSHVVGAEWADTRFPQIRSAQRSNACHTHPSLGVHGVGTVGAMQGRDATRGLRFTWEPLHGGSEWAQVSKLGRRAPRLVNHPGGDQTPRACNDGVHHE